MGGKKKEAQRTKGNVKPASSGHAAQLLEASGVLQTGFVGFDTLSGDLGYVPANLQSSEAAECSDGELRMIMKRLTKRDAVTKLKALQNLHSICQERESEVVVDSLKYWPRLYNKLAIDFDHRVREASHKALKEVAIRSGRNLAPHLKHLIGAWLLSLCDQYAPAASAARSAFDAVFPTEAKRVEALVYCHSELIKFLSEMLFTATPQTLSDAKVTPPEEMLEKYERVLSSSLLSLRLIIKMCPSEKVTSLSERCLPILESSAFWKFANHNNRSVKASFFSLLASLISDLPKLANEKADKLCPVVLSRLGENDPLVCPSLWEAVHSVTTIQAFWKHVNLRKAMLPGLWSTLKAGFDGNAAAAAGKFCILIKLLPPDASGSPHEFYSLLFSHFRSGLCLDKVQRSSKELNCLVLAYMQCIKIVTDWCASNEDFDLLEEILETQMLGILEKALMQLEKGLSKSCLFDEFAKFVLSFGSQAKGSSDRAAECYGCARDRCWENLSSLAKTCVTSSHGYSMTRLVSLLRSIIILKPDEGTSKARSVGFGKASAALVESEMELSSKEKLSHHHAELERTVELVADVSSRCIAESIEKKNIVRDAVLLCQLCGSELFYTKLAEYQGKARVEDLVDSCVKLCKIGDWQSYSKLIILMTEYVDTASALYSLVSLTKVYQSKNMDYLLKLVLSADWLKEIVSKWLSHDSFISHVHSLRGLFECIPQTDVQTISSCVSFFKTYLPVSNPDDDSFHRLCEVIQRGALAELLTTDSTELFIVLCDCIDAMLSHSIPVDIRVLSSHLIQRLTTTSPKDECLDTALALLTKLLGQDSAALSHILPSVKSALDASGNDVTRFSLICRLCCQMSSSLPEDFIDLLLKDIAENTEDTQLLKWLSIQAIQGYLVLDDTSCYMDFKVYDVHQSSPSIITYILFASEYLHHIKQSPASLSTALHRHLAAAHMWLTWLLPNKSIPTPADQLTPADCDGQTTDKVVSADRLSRLAYWLSDKEKNGKTCIDLMNTGNSVLDSLVLYAAASNLPKEFDATLSAQATLYMSTFEKLDEGKFQCLNVISHLISAQEAAELLDLVAARLISIKLEEVDWGWRGVTGLLHLATVLISRQETDNSQSEKILSILDVVSDMKAEFPHQLICEKYPYMWEVDRSSRLELNVSLMRLSSAVLKLCSHHLTSKQWDQLLCTLDSWMGEEKCMLPTELSVYHNQLFVCNVLKAVATAGQAMKAVSTSPSLYPKDLLSEWVELHALSIFNTLLPYFISKVEQLGTSAMTAQQVYVTYCLSKAHLYCPTDNVRKNLLPTKLVPGSTHHLPSEFESALNHLVPLLLSPSAVVQSSAFVLLNHLVPVLPPFDNQPLGEDVEGRCPPLTIISMIDHCSAQLLSLVGGARIGVDKQLDLQLESEELLCVRGYFLTWRLLLKYLEYANRQQIVEYAHHLKQNHYTDDLLLILFNVLPLDKPLPNGDSFNFNMHLNLDEVFDMAEVIAIASPVYYHLVKILPALVRAWHLDLEKRANAIVDRFTSKYICPRLCKEEMEQVSIQSQLQKSENLTVKVRFSSREIVATYTLEEFSIELLILLPTNYPVGVTSVECSKKLGVATSEWRKWMLQLNTFLTYQNGSVANAIGLWKDNLDKKFSGIEECYICYSVLHGTNLQLPKQQCKTCKKKFHSACLYKWFTSSQKSTCPLCRNLF